MYSLHLLALLIEDDVSAARLLWKRIPAPLKTEAGDLCRAWAVVKALAQGDYAEMHSLLRLEWGPAQQQAAQNLSGAVRRRRLKDISHAYDRVIIDTLMTQCDMTESEIEAGVFSSATPVICG